MKTLETKIFFLHIYLISIPTQLSKTAYAMWTLQIYVLIALLGNIFKILPQNFWQLLWMITMNFYCKDEKSIYMRIFNVLCDIVLCTIVYQECTISPIFNKHNFCEYAWKNSPFLHCTKEHYILNLYISQGCYRKFQNYIRGVFIFKKKVNYFIFRKTRRVIRVSNILIDTVLRITRI